MNITEIIQAWKKANNPTEYERELARRRMEICMVCPSRKELSKKIELLNICGECGCPISKKAFTPSYNPCPLQKWEKVDKPHFGKQKSEKSLI